MEGKMSTQQQSSFFTKLPPELQKLIYEFALGGIGFKVEPIDAKENPDRPFDSNLRFRLSCPEAQRLPAFPRSYKMA
jgi:hypothetical protein